MSELTPEERKKIYEEEKARLEARKDLEKKEKRKTKPSTWGCLILIIIGVIAIWTWFSNTPSSDQVEKTTPAKNEVTTSTKSKPEWKKEATPLPTKSEAQNLYIPYSIVVVRDGPSTSHEVIGQLKRYETIRGKLEGGWVRFTKDGKTGYTSKSVLKEASHPLHIKLNKFSVGDYGYFNVVGEVINTSKNTFQFVQVEATYLDDDKNVVGKDFTYACSNDYILPGRVKSFEFMGQNQPDYKSVTVRVKDYMKVN